MQLIIANTSHFLNIEILQGGHESHLLIGFSLNLASNNVESICALKKTF